MQISWCNDVEEAIHFLLQCPVLSHKRLSVIEDMFAMYKCMLT